jgi:uncharacterized protein YehS (DUF1456 family)
MRKINGVKVFSATKMQDRAVLGEVVTDWLRKHEHPGFFEVEDIVITQSSDNEFHCLAITVLYHEGVR